MQQFPAYPTIFFLSYQKFFLRLAYACLFPAYATISSLCNNFLAFLSEFFLMLAYATISSLCKNFLTFLSEILLETCLCNNFQLIQQFFFLSYQKFFLRLAYACLFPAYATISSLCNNFLAFLSEFFLMLAYATISSLCKNFLTFLSEILLETCLCNNF